MENNVDIVCEGRVIHTNMPDAAHHHAMPYINSSSILPLHIMSNIDQTKVCKYWGSICKCLSDWGLQISIVLWCTNLKFAKICWIAVGILIYAYIYHIEVCKNPLDWDVQISIGLRCANIYGIEFCKNPLDWYLQISIQLRCTNNHQMKFSKNLRFRCAKFALQIAIRLIFANIYGIEVCKYL